MKDVLFVGKGRTGVCYYRCALPATFLDAEWVGVTEPDDPALALAAVGRRVIIVQLPKGQAWVDKIAAWQAAGITVYGELDDDLHGITAVRGHAYASSFTPADLREYERCFAACDGLIVSTEPLARRYRRFNANITVCPNGIDLGRYALTRPERDRVWIGWSGATGHDEAMIPWLHAVRDVLEARPHAGFVSIGRPYTDLLVDRIGPEQLLKVPFGALETYPAAMCLMDVAIAPAGRSAWWRAKSDLRFLEAAALSIPLVADPFLYGESINAGVTGLLASSVNQARTALLELVDDASLRTRLGAAAHEHVSTHRAFPDAAAPWAALLAPTPAVATL